MSREIFNMDLYHIILFIFVYSFLGWVVESIAMSVKFKKLQNRGYIKGPFCTIYGIGGLIVYFALNKWSDNLVLMFFAGMIIATVFEYITAIIMEKLFGHFWWDYTDYPLNFQGKICLGNSIIWGLFSVGFFAKAHPFISGLIDSIPFGVGVNIIKILLTYYTIDFVVSTFFVFKKKENFKEKIDSKIENFKIKYFR